MDAIFIEGVAATVAAITVFVGSVFFLVTMIVGARLAYFLTATISLAFLFMMGLVWSSSPENPLGPVGVLPSWEGVGIGRDASAIDFGPARDYPEGDWRPPNEDDEVDQERASALENGATGLLEQQIEEGAITEYVSAGDAQANSELTRFLEQGDDLYGGVTLEPVQGVDAPQLIAILRYDPGDPLRTAYTITGGTFVLLVAHLIGLSRMEKRARRRREELEMERT